MREHRLKIKSNPIVREREEGMFLYGNGFRDSTYMACYRRVSAFIIDETIADWL
jgi:hypothetical protein